jgi:Rrf2 family nitric oxide-sensitive transcriptional repressor
MKLTTKTDYCLRILIYLQQRPGINKIKDIADQYQISKNHLSVAANKLSELDFIKTYPGPNGGIEFNEKMKQVSINHLIVMLEAFDTVECFNEEKNKCIINDSCKLKHMLYNSTQAFLNELKKYKIKDLI